MIAILLLLAAAAGTGLLFGALARSFRSAVRARANARTQADWDQHVDQAVKVSQTPLYERIAQEYAKDLDAEWRQVSTGGWATE